MAALKDTHIDAIRLNWPGRTVDSQVEQHSAAVGALASFCESSLLDAALALADFEQASGQPISATQRMNLEFNASRRVRRVYAISFLLSVSAVNAACYALSKKYAPRIPLDTFLVRHAKLLDVIRELRNAIAHQEDRVRKMAKHETPIDTVDNVFVNATVHNNSYVQTLTDGSMIEMPIDVSTLGLARDLAQAAICSIAWIHAPESTPR